MMGPIQGAIVNWCGHKYGYSNFDNGDHSKNSSPWGILLMGELFQNNHHYAKTDANFAKKWFEFDLTYIIMRGMHAIKIIELVPKSRDRSSCIDVDRNLRKPFERPNSSLRLHKNLSNLSYSTSLCKKNCRRVKSPH
jgi:hypothetical protein